MALRADHRVALGGTICRSIAIVLSMMLSTGAATLAQRSSGTAVTAANTPADTLADARANAQADIHADTPTAAHADTMRLRPLRIGVYAGLVGNVHINAVLYTVVRHDIATIDVAGSGFRTGVQLAFELAEGWGAAPRLGYASWIASGGYSDVPARVSIRGADGGSVDTTVPVNVNYELQYLLVEIAMPFEVSLRRIDDQTELVLGVGAAFSIVAQTLQIEKLELDSDGVNRFSNREALPTENDDSRMMFWNGQIYRRAFMRMSGDVSLSLVRDIGRSVSVRGSLALDIPFTSVVEHSSWLAFAASLTFGIQWRLP